jgi:hypothetical protein
VESREAEAGFSSHKRMTTVRDISTSHGQRAIHGMNGKQNGSSSLTHRSAMMTRLVGVRNLETGNLAVRYSYRRPHQDMVTVPPPMTDGWRPAR